MFDAINNILVVICCSVGAFFLIVGSIGLLRLPDPYSRLHSGSQCDTAGAGFILLGVIIHDRFNFDSLKVLVLLILVLIASANIVHVIARAVYRKGFMPKTKSPMPDGFIPKDKEFVAPKIEEDELSDKKSTEDIENG